MADRDLLDELHERELFEDVRVIVAIARWPEYEREWIARLRKEHPDEARIVAEMVYLLDARPEEQPVSRRFALRRRGVPELERRGGRRGKPVPEYARELLDRMREAHPPAEEGGD
jgi:hypothetical protein